MPRLTVDQLVQGRRASGVVVADLADPFDVGGIADQANTYRFHRQATRWTTAAWMIEFAGLLTAKIAARSGDVIIARSAALKSPSCSTIQVNTPLSGSMTAVTTRKP